MGDGFKKELNPTFLLVRRCVGSSNENFEISHTFPNKVTNTSTSAQVQTGHRNEFQMMSEELQILVLAKKIKKERIKSLVTNLDNVDVGVEELEGSLESLYMRI
ncbi:hypothetical protein YC2023_075217 [Brassica napus]